MTSVSAAIHQVLNRPLLFVHGKGGVGKTLVSKAIAKRLSTQGKTLWIAIEDPTRPPGELLELSPTLWHLNCDFTLAFEQYAAMKIGLAPLTRIFLQNKLIRYLARAAPGIHELVLLGKIWFERTEYSHVIVDMPSTGYGLAMFQSTQNFVKLFHGGPLHRDADQMIGTFSDPTSTGHLIVSLPEEMPLRESLELRDFLIQMFPQNPPAFMVNRKFPAVHFSSQTSEAPAANPDEWASPLADSIEDYAQKRSLLEEFNLRLWRDQKISFGTLDFAPPPKSEDTTAVLESLAKQLQEKAYL